MRITHPTAQSYPSKSLSQIYQQHEKEKDKYNQSIIDVKKFSFSPCVFITSGGTTPKCL